MEYFTIEIIILLIFLFLSAFFSGSETALFSLKVSDIHRFSISERRIERRIASSMQESHKILITILIGNLFVNLIVSAISTRLLLTKWPLCGHLISIAVVTPLIIIFCEITPKVMSINYYREISRKVFPLLKFFHRILYPLRKAMLVITDLLMRVFNLKMNENITEDALGHALRVGEEEGVIDREESKFIKNVMRFSKKEASNIMFPRNRAVFIPYGATIEEAIKIFLESDIIRCPVYRDDLDHVVGMVDSRKLLPYYLGYKKAKNINRFINEIDFFPASRELNELLQDFLLKKIQIAIVVDEYGGTAGVVTLNAILSELMGKEFTKWEVDTRPDIRKTVGKISIISGEMQIDDFNFTFEEKLESVDTETMGGYMIEKLAHFPRRGESMWIENYQLRVKYIKKNKIESIEVIPDEACEDIEKG